MKRENVKRWSKYRWRRFKRLPLGVLGVLVGLAVASSVAGFLGSEQGWKRLWQSLGSELGGTVVTYILLDLVLGARRRKEALIAQLNSDVRDRAVSAIEELRQEGWLFDGSLNGVSLIGATL